MHFVSASAVDCLSPPVAAEKSNGRIVVAHEDGTVVLRDEIGGAPIMVWLNPGRSVRAISMFDDSVLVALDNQQLKKFSLDTGILLSEVQLSVVVARFTVFEHIVVGFSRSNAEITIFHRHSLEVLQTIDTNTFVVDVFACHGEFTVVCSSHVYILQSQQNGFGLKLVFNPDYLVVAATTYAGSWVLASPDKWRLISVAAKTYQVQEDFCIEAPDLLVETKEIGVGVLLQCRNHKYVFLRDNNIQVVDGPSGILSSHGIWSANHMCYTFTLSGYELSFHHTHGSNAKLADCKYLVGYSDPSITAVHGEYIGNEHGEINGTKVLPGPILYIDAHRAYSKSGSVRLPLEQVNSVDPVTGHPQLSDHRISIPTINCSTIQQENWVGMYPDICLQPNIVEHAHIAVLHILAGTLTLEQAVSRVNTSQKCIVALENLVVCASETNKPKLKDTSARLLAKIWGPDRIVRLLKSSGPRSVRILAAMAPYCDIDTRVIVKMVNKLAQSSIVTDNEAVLWVFSNQFSVVKHMEIPFKALQDIAEPAVARFAQNMVELDSNKLLNDAQRALNTVDVQYAIKLLLAAITSTSFPVTEQQLITLVQMVLPAINNRVPGAKSVLTKLLATNRMQYHQSRQKLLIPTPRTKDQAAVVIDVMSHEQQVLQNITTTDEIQPIFSGDGRSVMAVAGGKRYAWHIVKSFPFFHQQSIDPVEIN